MIDIEKDNILIASLETALEGIKRDNGECDKVYIHITKALFAFNQIKPALQEKLEREKGCDYCKLICSSCKNENEIICLNCTNGYNLFSNCKDHYVKDESKIYCKKCGRKLEGK